MESDIENKFPQPYPSLLVSWSHGKSSKHFHKVKRFLKKSFHRFAFNSWTALKTKRPWDQEIGMKLKKFIEKNIIWKNKFPQPYPSLLVSWSHGESCKNFNKVKRFFKKVFIDFQPIHEQLGTPRDHETKRLGWNSRNLLKKMIFWRKKIPPALPQSLGLLVSWWILQALLWSLKILNTVFVYFHPKHLLIQILEINSRSPTPVSWSRGLMVNLPS